jgi:uncharacterized repeat protein (TIGR01451 family)
MFNRGAVGEFFARARVAAMFALVVGGGSLLLRHDAVHQHPSAKLPANNPEGIRAAFGRLPLSFEPNQGQSDVRAKFLTRGNGYGLYLMPTEAVLFLPAPSQKGAQKGVNQASVGMSLEGANVSSVMTGTEPLPGHSNYFIGNDPSRWRRNIPQFARVVSHDVYPGIDLAFYGKQGQVEYDFDVAPGADPRQIEIAFKGAKDLRIADNGDLVLSVDGAELRFRAPQIYQTSGAGIQSVGGSFVLRDNRKAGFEVGSYDRSRTLVIDPVLVFSTYLGGSGNESCGVIVNGSQTSPIAHCPAVAVDSASRVYVAGVTRSPSSAGAFSGTTPTPIGPLASTNVFVARLNPSGTALDYVTYVGGSGVQYPAGVGVDGGFNVYVAGTTNSANFPTTSTAFQTAASGAGNNHVFLTKLDSSGSANLYTTYLSGSGVDTASGLAVDGLGDAYVMGTTSSPDFPITGGALQTSTRATNQFFFAKINAGLSATNSLAYSTYIGGSTPTNGIVTGGAVAVDSNFNVYLAGGTNFDDMPVVNAYKSTEQGGFDVWAARLTAPANNTQQYTPSYETYFGGTGDDIAYGIATDGVNTYITGSTTSPGLTAAVGTAPFQTCLDQPPPNPISCASSPSPSDAYIAKFGLPTTTGTTQGSVPLAYFSYLGGSATDVGLGIVADSLANARVVGWTNSSDFPSTVSLGSTGGPADAFVARIVTNGTTTSNTNSISKLGGGGADIGTSIAVDPSLNIYVAGDTSSSNFPTTAGGLQTGLSGTTDAFVSELGPSTSGLTFACAITGCPANNPVVTPSPAVNVGGLITFTYSIYNTGDPVSGVVFTDTLGPNTTFSSATSSSGTCGGVNGGTVVCNLGTVNSSIVSSTTSVPAAAATVTIVVAATTQVLPASGLQTNNSATLTLPSSSVPFTAQHAQGAAQINDFTVSATPAVTPTVITAGSQADYSVLVTPTGAGFPASVSLSCGSGLPAGATCVFTSGNPIPNLTNGPRSVPLAIQTTFRVTTPGSLYLPGGTTYALWLHVFGLPILGAGLVGAGLSRKRRILLGAFFAVLLGTALLQMGCGSSKPTSTTTGTPPGTYTVTINATAGATRTTTVTFTVQ